MTGTIDYRFLVILGVFRDDDLVVEIVFPIGIPYHCAPASGTREAEGHFVCAFEFLSQVAKESVGTGTCDLLFFSGNAFAGQVHLFR